MPLLYTFSCRNLTDDVGEDLLRETFGQFGEMEKVGGRKEGAVSANRRKELFWANQRLGKSLLNRLVQVKKVKNFAFIHYNDRSSALAAIDAMHEEQVASGSLN